MTELTGALNRAVVRLGHPLGYREAKPRPGSFARARLVRPEEAVENARQVLIGNPDSRVFELQDCKLSFGKRAELHASPGRRVFDGVVEQRQDQPLNGRGISAQPQRLPGQVLRERQTLLQSQKRALLRGLMQQGSQRHVFKVKLRGTQICPRQGKQRVDQARGFFRCTENAL